MTADPACGNALSAAWAADLPLDELSRDALDALPFGVVQLDGAGRVMFYSAAESRLSGRSAADVIGRDFFRDVAPCTHLPAFHGRFLEGVRRGRLDERFHFVFSFAPRPVQVEVGMRAAREADRYWITMRALAVLSPTRHRVATQAVAAVERRIRAESIDPGVCEREPIHVPGAIQPYAVMLVCDPQTLFVQACSDNVANALGEAEPAGVIGLPLDAVLPADLVRDLRNALAAGELDEPKDPLRRTVRLGSKVDGGDAAPFAAAVHLYDGRLMVELERVAEHPEDFGAATPLQAQRAVARLRAAPALTEAAAVAAREIRAMTGFERVLIYRFDTDWNGEAVAENRAEGWEQSLLGLRFPASDIPAQARTLYTRSPSRFVVDRDAVSSTLLAEPQTANQVVDLTYAQARALSPVHLEYQRNLGVNGSMSISILIEGRLWGLVIGHHRKPHYVTPETRALAGVVADAFGLRMNELESVRLWREQQATLAAQNRLLEQLAASDDFVSALLGASAHGGTLLDLFVAGGAAVISKSRVGAVGTAATALPSEALLVFAEWLRRKVAPNKRVFATDRLSEHYAPAEAWQATASGLLAAFVGDGDAGQGTEHRGCIGREHLLLWFRPEVAATVIWGGDPNKPVLADPATGTVLPRRSFERWVEERRGRAEPWAPWEIGTAEALAAAIEGVVLRQGRRIAELTAKQEALSRALEQKDVLAREIDHRVKNSLQIVAGMILMQARGISDPTAKAAFENTYARIMGVARVHDSLQHSEDVESVDLGQTLRQICADLAAGVVGTAQRLEIDAAPELMVPSRTAVALSLVATELVTNALKYAYAPGEAGHVAVSVRARLAGGVELRVCDEGKGLPLDWSDRPRVSGKGGLGMRVIQAMLQQIGAEMTVRSDRPGTCFTVSA